MKSYQEWLKEFYPKSAEEAARTPGATDLDLIRHSLRKWRGLDVIDDYNVVVGEGIHPVITDPHDPDEGIEISGTSCALCERHHISDVYDEDGDDVLYCHHCPFMVVFGCTCDTESSHRLFAGNAWYSWAGDRDAKPMIRALTVLEEHYMKLEETK